MGWLLLTFLAVTSRAVYSLGAKVLTNRLLVSSPTQAVLLTGATTFMALVVSPLLGGISIAGLDGAWDTVLLMITTQAVGNVFFFRGQQELDAGTSQIAFSSIVIWGTLLSTWLLGSKFSLQQAVGITILVAAIILIQHRKGHRKPSTAVLAIIVSAASFAAFQVTSAQISRQTTAATYLLLAYGGPTLLTSLVFVKRVRREIPVLWGSPRKHVGEGILFAAATSFAYFTFSYFAYRQAPDPGVVVVLLTTQMILSVILGAIFLRERTHPLRKAIATCLAFIASVMIKA